MFPVCSSNAKQSNNGVLYDKCCVCECLNVSVSFNDHNESLFQSFPFPPHFHEEKLNLPQLRHLHSGKQTHLEHKPIRFLEISAPRLEMFVDGRMERCAI